MWGAPTLRPAHLVLEQSHVVVGGGWALLCLFLQLPRQRSHVQPEVPGAGVALGRVTVGTGTLQPHWGAPQLAPAVNQHPKAQRCTHQVMKVPGAS